MMTNPGGSITKRIETIRKLLAKRGPLGAAEIERLTGYSKGEVAHVLFHKNEFVRAGLNGCDWANPGTVAER